MGTALFNDLLIIFVLAIVVLFVCQKLRIPAIVGFLLTGVLVGPYGLGLIHSIEEVDLLAEIGIVLLLFTIGIEFSLENLIQIKKTAVIGGSLQVLLTIALVAYIARTTGLALERAIFLGFLISLSSTAIVLVLLQARAEMHSPHGRAILAILIFQDIIIVPMMLVTPLLAGATADPGSSLFVFFIKAIGVIVVLLFSSKWLVPQFLYQIVKTRSRELFLFSIVVICFAIAWLTSSVGLSLALGAFMAGLIISESEYSHQALGNILPFRDVFMGLFFVSMGMLFDVHFLLQHIWLVLLITSCVFVLKTVIAGAVTAVLGYPLRSALLVGLGLCQVGEFSFVLSRTGTHYGLLAPDIYQTFLAVSIVTMAVTPFIVSFAPRIADYVYRLPLPQIVKSGFSSAHAEKDLGKKDHLMIIGFGLNGRNLARAAKAAHIPYVIIDMNPDTVRHEKAKGEPIYYGDATHETVLKHADIEDARVLVVAIYDAPATRRITELARRLNPKLYIIARTRFLEEMQYLHKLGANEVIPEEFETSIEIFGRVLRKYLVPRREIERFIADVRGDGYEMLRSLAAESPPFSDLKGDLPDIEIAALRVYEKSRVTWKTLDEIDMRKKHGVTVLGIRRTGKMISNPSGEMKLHAEDVLVVLGAPDKIFEVSMILEGSEDTHNGVS